VGRLRVAFIGGGRIADLHALGYRDNPKAELYAVCDAREEVARGRAEEWGAPKHCTDYRDLLKDRAIEIVEVITPHHLHAEMTIASLEAGKHVSVQKPMALNLTEADAMIAAAARSGRKMRVLENFRYYPPNVKAKELIEEGAIGEPLSIRLKVIGGSPEYGWPVPMEAWMWRVDDVRCGGGPSIFDHGYHMFSMAMYFLGAVEKVFGWIEKTEVAPGMYWDAPAMLIWKYRDGARFGCWETVGHPRLVVRSDYYANDEWVEITGSEGLVWVNQCSGHMLERPAMVLYRQGKMTEYHDLETDWASSFVRGVHDFIDAIREDRECSLSGEEAREILRFSLAAHLSAREHREVYLDEVTG